ncbi:hypothetical protein Scep_014991 [Stephania cephalantha]|uniref:Uncharacterized protein n=1 Tax=Stephania cephalantha TaxID=152367 RepID=A0AAP0P2C3_9MAGN
MFVVRFQIKKLIKSPKTLLNSRSFPLLGSSSNVGTLEVDGSSRTLLFDELDFCSL